MTLTGNQKAVATLLSALALGKVDMNIDKNCVPLDGQIALLLMVRNMAGEDIHPMGHPVLRNPCKILQMHHLIDENYNVTADVREVFDQVIDYNRHLPEDQWKFTPKLEAIA